MTKRIRMRGEEVRKFILGAVDKHSQDLARVTAEKFGISRQAANKHLKRLTVEGVLAESGQTRSKTYKLRPDVEWKRSYAIKAGLAEDVVWATDIRPALGELPENVMNIWHYAFTEMFNNAIDHSEGTTITAEIARSPAHTDMAVNDDGVGIFRKIQRDLKLLDERHAVLELSKGKLTTDPKAHSGQGIFFTSRAVDIFSILSGGVSLAHRFGVQEDFVMDRIENSPAVGTTVLMRLDNHTARTLRSVFDEYTSGDDLGFTKTIVPVRLAQYGSDELISRSQAKRVLARVQLFKTVLMDFEKVPAIGQPFADEMFRVFKMQHPEVTIVPTGANEEVARAIDRALADARSDLTQE